MFIDKEKFNQMNILFIGVGYFPSFIAGDKNFWVELINLLCQEDSIKINIV